MNSFVINATNNNANFKIDRNFLLKDKHDGQFIIRNNYFETTIKEGDSFASLKKEKSNFLFYQEVKMLNKGVIQMIRNEPDDKLSKKEIELNQERINEGKEPLKYFNHNFFFQDGELFQKYSFLDDYAYSLLKVYKRFINPIRHFNRVVTQITNIDFETFEEERIFIERTLFGRLINSLPYENRLQFILLSINKYKTIELTEIPLNEALEFLKNFVSSGIIKMGSYIVETQKLINKNAFIFNNQTAVGFASNDISNEESRLTEASLIKFADYIGEQSKLFENLQIIEPNFISLFSSREFGQLNYEKLKFAEIFSKRLWPVDLTLDSYD